MADERGLSACYQEALDLGDELLRLLQTEAPDAQQVLELVDRRGKAAAEAQKLLDQGAVLDPVQKQLDAVVQQQGVLQTALRGSLEKLQVRLGVRQGQQQKVQDVRRLLGRGTRSGYLNERR